MASSRSADPVLPARDEQNSRAQAEDNSRSGASPLAGLAFVGLSIFGSRSAVAQERSESALEPKAIPTRLNQDPNHNLESADRHSDRGHGNLDTDFRVAALNLRSSVIAAEPKRLLQPSVEPKAEPSGPAPIPPSTPKQGVSNGEVIAVSAAKAWHIAVDAMIATFARLREFENKTHAFKWAGAIATTHTVLPMVGFLGGWGGNNLFSSLAPLICATGVYACTKFVGGTLLPGLRGKGGEEGGSIVSDPTKSKAENRKAFGLAVWAVSVDALVSGVITNSTNLEWSSTQALASFPMVGAAVGCLVLASAAVSFGLKRKLEDQASTISPQDLDRKATSLGKKFELGVWSELAVFNYFGVNAAYATIQTGAAALGIGALSSTNVPLVTGLALGNTLRLFFKYGAEIRNHQRAEAAGLVKGE